MNGKPRKGRGLPPRASRGRMMERQQSYDGAFANHRLLQTMGSLVGYTMQVQTKNKEIYEGIFSSMSSKFEVVLELPHTINGVDGAITNLDLSKKKMIFSRDDIVTLKMIAVDVEFASKDTFAIDSAISSKQNGQLKERTLQPWENFDETPQNLELEENENGWDATDMFKRNEEIYGVQTTYKPDMEGYTTPLPKRDTKEWKEHEVQAHKIAHEIEQSATTQARAELENGQNEEERFSSVVRSEKFIMPQRRKTYSSKAGPRGPQPNAYNAASPPQASGAAPPAAAQHRKNPATPQYDATPNEKAREEKASSVTELKKFGKVFSLSDGGGDNKTAETSNAQKYPASARTVTAAAPPIEEQAAAPQAAQAPESMAKEDMPAQVVAPVEEKKEISLKPISDLNPNAKVFTPRSIATPPPVVQATQQLTGGHPLPLVGQGGMAYPQNYLPTYLVPQMLNHQQRPVSKRAALVGQRNDFSQMQVANATGQPLLTSQGPIANLPTVLQANQYSHYPVVMRYPTPLPATMLTTMMPGSYPQADMSQGTHLHGQQPLYMGPGVMHHTGAQQPPQAHTPQANHNPGSLAAHQMQPTQPPTPGPSPSQNLYGGPVSGMGNQAALPTHLPPHVPTHHNSQFGGHGAVATHPQALLMLPPQMQSTHLLAPPNNNQHAGAQIPVSLPYSSNSIVHVSHHGSPFNYMPGAHGNQLPIVHNQ